LKPGTDSFSEYFQSLKAEIDSRLEGLPLPSEPAYLYEPVRYALKGRGKRLRPILVCLSGRAYGVDFERTLTAALAVELVHNFTLIHDDIMDADELRHGQPAVHAKWDVSTALLAGDALFTQAQLLMTGAGDRIQQRLNQVTLIVCEGQALDKEFEGDENITLEAYLEMIGRKTGTLLGYCSETGGRLAGQTEKICQKLFDYGRTLGVAFQIQDDLLEIFGSTEDMGKSLGSDLTANKQTILTILARRRDPDRWKEFCQTAQSHSAEKRRNEFGDYYETEGIYEQARSVVESTIQRARELISVFPEEGQRVIHRFTEMILNRTF